MPDTACELWLGRTDRKGYGRSNGKLVHRREYERHFGPIPPGLEDT